MSNSDPGQNPDPTADYRKYSKGPNFLLIVILSGVAIIVVMVIAYFAVGDAGKKMIPHGPSPTPNARITRPASGSTHLELRS